MVLNCPCRKRFWTMEGKVVTLPPMTRRKRRDANSNDGHGGPRKTGRPPVEHEREEFTVRLRAKLMDLVREEMSKSRPMPPRNDMIEVLIEDGLIVRGYRERMEWLPPSAQGSD